MAGHNPDNKMKPFENGNPKQPFRDPEARNADAYLETRKLQFKNKVGAPSTYTEDIAVELCAHIAEGMTLRQVCRLETMPNAQTVYDWLSKHREFSDLFARASQIKLMGLADDILDIADDSRNDWIERELKGGSSVLVPDNEVVNRSRLRVETRRWLLAKLMPKVYGEKVTLDINDKHAVTLQAARARLAQRKAIEQKREQSIDAQAMPLPDDQSIEPADVHVVDAGDIMDELD